MVIIDILREIALSFPETIEESHFEKKIIHSEEYNLCNL